MRYKITVEYDGTNFYGWQRQNYGNTVQDEIEAAILAFSGQKVNVVASGRTDSGVHAIGQVAHFDLDGDYAPFRIMSAINYYLRRSVVEENTVWQKAIRKYRGGGRIIENTIAREKKPFTQQQISILDCKEVGEDFHARFSAKKRYYKYKILNRRQPTALLQNRCWHVIEDLDIDKMQEGAKYLIGEHDFSSFRCSECQAKSPIRVLDEIKIYQDDSSDFAGKNIIVEISAQSFLHNMVRNIVGTLKMVGIGKIKPEEVKRILEAKDRCAAGITASPYGLYFWKVDY